MIVLLKSQIFEFFALFSDKFEHKFYVISYYMYFNFGRPFLNYLISKCPGIFFKILSILFLSFKNIALFLIGKISNSFINKSLCFEKLALPSFQWTLLSFSPPASIKRPSNSTQATFHKHLSQKVLKNSQNLLNLKHIKKRLFSLISHSWSGFRLLLQQVFTISKKRRVFNSWVLDSIWKIKDFKEIFKDDVRW